MHQPSNVYTIYVSSLIKSALVAVFNIEMTCYFSKLDFLRLYHIYIMFSAGSRSRIKTIRAIR